MHNRARMLTASFLVKELGIDWRLGARHFSRRLVDGDVANNSGNWQWIAGTGNDTRPNRRFNLIRQAQRHDPDGAYVRRYVPGIGRDSRRRRPPALATAHGTSRTARLPRADRRRRGHEEIVMGLRHTSIVEAPLEQVFAWHERPGVLRRLAPPWQPIRVIEEAASLRDGKAILRLPGGVRWVAQHSGYDPPHRFAGPARLPAAAVAPHAQLRAVDRVQDQGRRRGGHARARLPAHPDVPLPAEPAGK